MPEISGPNKTYVLIHQGEINFIQCVTGDSRDQVDLK